MKTRKALGWFWFAGSRNAVPRSITPRTGPGRTPVGILVAWGLLFVVSPWMTRPAAAFLMEPLDGGLVGVTLTLSGETTENIQKTASLEAVRACVGRIFWGRELLIAQDLLTSYLQENHARFVKGIETLRTDFLAGRPQLTLRVYVDNRALQQDLRAKRFVIEPRPRPFFKVFLAEKLGAEFATYSTGRDALTAALQDRNLRPYEGIIERPPANADVAGDSVLLEDALVACERHNVELLVSGTSVTTRQDRKEMYYDTYYFYTTVMKVGMVRVDTGTVLAQAEARGTAGHTDEQQAIDLSITRASNEITNQLTKTYEEVWGPMVLDRANYHLLLTGVTPQTLNLVKDALAKFSPDSKVYVRQSFDRTAGVNVVFPGKREELIKAISTNPYPTLKIVPEKTIKARLTGVARTRLVQRTDVSGRTVPGQQAQESAGLYTFAYQSQITLRLFDLRTDKPVVEVTGEAKADGLEAGEVAMESWRNALGQALSDLNEQFPQSIHEVILREASYGTLLPREDEGVARALVDRLKQDSLNGTVSQETGDGQWKIVLSYAKPKDPDESLLGKDPFLPDITLGASPRRNYLEIQVGE